MELTSTADDVIIHGSTWASIWHMSWPLLLNMATFSVASFADVWVAGKLGPDSQAAIGIAGQIGFLMIMLAAALSTGTTALVSRFWGARDPKKTIEAARQSLLFAAIFGATSALIGLACSLPLLRFLGASRPVESLAWNYLKFDMLSQFPWTVLWVSNSIFRAKGNARVPMIIMSIMTVMIIVLNFALCLWPLHIGVAGIGLSWLVSAGVGMIVSLYVLRLSEIGECLNPRAIAKDGLSGRWLMLLMGIGIPACIQDVVWVAGNFVLFLIFARTPDPTSCQASWAVGLRVEEIIAGTPIYALAMAVATIVGQNLGAKQPRRAERAGWQVAGIGAILNGLVGLLMFLQAGPIASMMSTDAKVTGYATEYLKIVGLSEPFVATWLILFGAMQGAGYTRLPMWTAIICLVGLRLPLCWHLTINCSWGPSGTWLGLAISSAVIGSLAVLLFKSGDWKTERV